MWYEEFHARAKYNSTVCNTLLKSLENAYKPKRYDSKTKGDLYKVGDKAMAAK